MGIFILRRVGVMILTALCLTFVVFFLTNLYPALEKLAKTQGNQRMSDEAVVSYLERNGHLQPLLVKYGQWLGVIPGYVHENPETGAVTARCATRGMDPSEAPRFCGLLQGDWGFSTVFKDDVSSIIAIRLGLTGKLMFWVLVVMVPSALIIGVLAGMREGSRLDRSLSTFSIASTATPEYVSGVILITLLASSAGWKIFKGTATSAADNATLENFLLPVLTISLYGVGYIARMTRASMTEVMTAQFIRTARLKGVSFRNVVLKHALRNALIAPFTVIMLQIPWLLSGVIVVEFFFAYKGFGALLLEASLNQDILLIEAASMVAVFVVVATQTLSDIGYTYLNPRIRFT